ncbi:MAG: SDR family oxidoreductase [Clostridia bacterium]|nr:SDR family oxidoreductase [Clostridia bacterium]
MSVLFITAATKNTGLAIAEKFADNGFDIALSSRNLGDAQAAAAYISEKYHVKSKGYALELTNVPQIRSVFGQIKEDFGGIDTFVANAANLGVDTNLLTIDEEEYENVMDVNLKGSFFCAQQAALIMKESHGGSVVFVSSVHSHQCIFGRSLYSASKGGINSLMRAMAIELAQYNIRANCIIAGAIRTDRWDNLTKDQMAARRANWPLGIESTGEDIANGVFYLGSDLSKTVTGTELTVDSGISISLLPYKEAKR